MQGILGAFIRDPSSASIGPLRNAVEPTIGRFERFADDTAFLCSARALGDQKTRFHLVSTGRIHNRVEVADKLGCCSARSSDQFLLERAHERWGERACEHLYGDWSYAAWDPGERRLTLARDRYGNTQLFYYADSSKFAFATRLQDLLALNLAPVTLDELYLAQTLISWTAYHGRRTIHDPIKRLPPAHIAIATPRQLLVSQYWTLGEAPEIRLPKRTDYVERLRELFDRAVGERIPDDVTVAATLSGGLDSGSVATTAARILRKDDRRLAAYTSTPISDTTAYCLDSEGDEFPWAKATADFCSNMVLRRVEAAESSPVKAMRELLEITRHPEHAACSAYWLLELYRAAANEGAGLLLTGQMGNAGISWNGGKNAWPVTIQIAREGPSSFIRRRVQEAFPPTLRAGYSRWRGPRDFSGSAISRDFAERLDLSRLWANDPMNLPYPSARAARLAILRPGASILGAVQAQLGAAVGIEVSDPTADPRVLEFCLAVPDAIFVDPATGTDRWLVREAMRDRLPTLVRENRRVGQQAADIVPRLRAHADEVEAVLDEISRGPAAAFIDSARLAVAWQRVQVEDSPAVLRLTMTTLTRGMMAGMFVNSIDRLRSGEKAALG